MRENQLNELEGTSILTKEFYNKIIRRIESTKPLAGFGTAIKQEENGISISISGFGSKAFNEKKINVCSGGVPVSITVYGP
jgi:hypothetical protein